MFSLILRGSQATSRLTLSSMMQLIYYINLLLCCYSLLSSALSLQCNDTQYAWPFKNPTFCCTMCPPGQYMRWRDTNTCAIKCNACTGDRYTDTYSNEMTCKICVNCNKRNINMEYEIPCSATQKAVCRCKAGYQCKDTSCTSCIPKTSQKPTTSTRETVKYKASSNNTQNDPCKSGDCTPIPATRRPTLLLPISAMTPQTPSTKPAKPIKDTVWFLVIIFLLCAGIVIIISTKIKPIMHWIRSKHDYSLANKPIPGTVQVSLSTEDDEVSKPVQEVCGKCDQPIDV